MANSTASPLKWFLGLFLVWIFFGSQIKDVIAGILDFSIRNPAPVLIITFTIWIIIIATCFFRVKPKKKHQDSSIIMSPEVITAVISTFFAFIIVCIFTPYLLAEVELPQYTFTLSAGNSEASINNSDDVLGPSIQENGDVLTVAFATYRDELCVRVNPNPAGSADLSVFFMED